MLIKNFFSWLFDLRVQASSPLHKVALFWWSIFIFVVPAIFLVIPFFCLCWPSPSEYDAIVARLRLPLLIASIAIPFSVSIARFHASKQMAEKLVSDEKNATFKLYFEHKKEYISYLEHYLEKNDSNHEIIQDGQVRRVARESLLIDFGNPTYKTVFPYNMPKQLKDIDADVERCFNIYKLATINAITSISQQIRSRKEDATGREQRERLLSKIIFLEIEEIYHTFGILVEFDNTIFLNNHYDSMRNYMIHHIPSLVSLLCSFELNHEGVLEKTLIQEKCISIVDDRLKSWQLYKLIEDFNCH